MPRGKDIRGGKGVSRRPAPVLVEHLVAQPANSASRTTTPNTPPFWIEGRVCNALTGYPVVGVRVDLLTSDLGVTDTIAAHGKTGTSSFGNVVTGTGGRFQLPLTPASSDAFFALRKNHAAKVTFRITQAGDQAELAAITLPASAAQYATLSIAFADVAITKKLWMQLGERMESTRTVQLNAVARQLVLLPPEQSLFGDWKLSARQAMLARLEQAFLDPRGDAHQAGITTTFRARRQPGALKQIVKSAGPKLFTPKLGGAIQLLEQKRTNFTDVFAVDWVLDPALLQEASPEKAFAKAQDSYAHAPQFGDLAFPGTFGRAKPRVPTDASRYRDYLRSIFTGPRESDSYSEYLAKLENRFKQDFQTLDVDEKPANELCVGVVKKILQAAKGGAKYGFGIAAAAIEAQGERTNREYLDYLIGLTKLSARELGLRYRIDLERPDVARSNPVQENIDTLHAFYADGFQSDPDPEPIYAAFFQGRAPFFLEYEEWLAQQAPFYGENYYQIHETFALRMNEKDTRQQLKDTIDNQSGDNQAVGYMIYADDTFAEARDAFTKREYQIALEKAEAAYAYAYEALKLWYGKDSVYASTLKTKLQSAFEERANLPMENLDDLDAFIRWHVAPAYVKYHPQGDWYDWLDENHEKFFLSCARFCALIIPSFKGDVALATGDFEGAVAQYERLTRFLMARGKTTSLEGYAPSWQSDPQTIPELENSVYTSYARLYISGRLPYTTPRFSSDDEVLAADWYGWTNAFVSELVADGLLHPMEMQYFKLRHGIALLAWADALYRTDTPSPIARAREIYKAVMWLHGDGPGLSPHWPKKGLDKKWVKDLGNLIANESVGGSAKPGAEGSGNASPYQFYKITKTYGAFGLLQSGALALLAHSENPAVTSQKKRAKLGFAQIEAGLNFYGLSDSIVPFLRFGPLKDAADRFTGIAKSAQQDFLNAMEKIEAAMKEEIVSENMIKKAQLQVRIAKEQQTIAYAGVQLAQKQVHDVEKQIEAKKKELEDKQSFWGQVKDFFGGVKDVISGLPGELTGFAGDGSKATALAAFSGSSGGGGGGAAAGGASAAAVGGGVMAGYAILVYASYTTMSNMADSYNSLADQIKVLETQALPLAKAQLKARESEVAIAQLHQQLAAADAELAGSLIHFQHAKFLNPEFWAHVAGVMQRVLERFLALGGRFAWMAERALAYEQDRPINIIRFDYFPEALQGVTGADLLRADLGELEASRLAFMKQTVPVKKTYSLAFDFPLQFAQLKKTGRCIIYTREEPYRLAYPGTYGYRIRDVRVATTSFQPKAIPRGIVTNQGVSLVTRSEGQEGMLLRPPEGLPISEFRLAQDMAVYGLPNEALMTFEGSGVETFWEITFPRATDTQGLVDLADVEITVDARAQYSPLLADAHAAQAPASVKRFALFAAHGLDPDALEKLADPTVSSVPVLFDLAAVKLPDHEENRKVSNIVIFAPGIDKGVSLAATLASGSKNVPVVLEDGLALSNDSSFMVGQAPPPEALNAFVGSAVAQAFTLTIDKNANSAVDLTAVKDIVLGVEYSAELVG